MKHFKKIESKFLFSLLIMSVWSIIAVGQTTAKISKHIPEIEKWIQKQFAKGKTPPFSFICDGKPSAEFIRQWDYSQQKIESEDQEELVCISQEFDDVIAVLFVHIHLGNHRADLFQESQGRRNIPLVELVAHGNSLCNEWIYIQAAKRADCLSKRRA